MTDTNDPGNGFGNDFGNFSGDRGWGDSSGGYATAGDHNARTGYPDYSGYPAAGIGTGTGTGTGDGRDAGFFSALFDFSFRKYATPSIVKTIYVLVTIVVSLGALVGIITGAAAAYEFDSDFGPLFLLFGVPFILIAVILQLALVRVLLESSLARIRSAQSLQNLEQRP